MEFPCNVGQNESQDAIPMKIPRPANAFMLYANANRKKMARAFPLDSNKEISKRLGKSWKELNQDQKNVFYALAKKVDDEHKKKYPDYVYNPKEARLRKAMRDANRERSMGTATATRGGFVRSRTQPWILPEHEEQFLMHQHGLRNAATPLCANGFPIVAGNQFMVPTMLHSAYSKHTHQLSGGGESPYFETNAMCQLQQQQADLWHCHEGAPPMRPPPQSGDMFVLNGSQMATTFQQQQQQQQREHNVLLLDAVHKSMAESPSSNESHKNGSFDGSQSGSGGGGGGGGSSTGLHDSGFMDMLREEEVDDVAEDEDEQEVILRNPFERAENVKNRKKASRTQKSPLPDFNEAFGSTERGRFQSPPHPRLPPKQAAYADNYVVINSNSQLRFDDF